MFITTIYERTRYTHYMGYLVRTEPMLFDTTPQVVKNLDIICVVRDDTIFVYKITGKYEI